jgi:signal transduction histidine kinase/ActR/RegA family two-component response regulator
MAQPGRIVVVGIYQNPPKVYADENGNAKGFFVDLIREIARLEGWDLRFSLDSWTNNLKKLENGEIDLMTDVAYSESRLEKFDYNNETVVSDWFQAYAASDVKINSILDLDKMRIAVLADSIQLDYLKSWIKNLGQNCEVVERSDYQLIFQAVKNGEADVLLTNRFAGKLLGPKYGVKETSLIFNPTSLHFAAGKGKNADLLARIDRHLKSWKHDSQSFYYRCLTGNLSEKTDYKTPRWLINLVSSLIILILSAVLVVYFFRLKLSQRTAELSLSNQRLQQALKELKDAHEKAVNQERLNALGQMASGIAHDFNNILTPVTGFSEMLIDSPDMLEDKEQLIDYLKSIRDAGYDGVELVKRMKSFYRMQEVSQEKQNTDLNELVHKVIQLTRPRWKEQTQKEGRAVEIEFFGEAKEKIAVFPSLVREVLVNILFNAVDAMPEGGRISIRTFDESEYIGVSIRDTGHGMTPEVLNNCFKAFYTTKGEHGTGIGLSMVKEICEQHDARLEVESSPGVGTEFRILFPLNAGAARVKAEKTGILINQSLKVLVVDDDARVLRVTEAMLKNEGHQLTCFTDATKAISEALETDFDLVITDFSMPDFTGLQLIKEIRRKKPLQKCLLLSGSNIEEAMFELHELGVRVIEKPLRINNFNEFLIDVFQKSLEPLRNKGSV